MPNRPLLILIALLLTLLPAACDSSSALSVYLEANRAQLSQPAGVDSQPAPFTVPPGAPAKAIAQDLQAAGLINDALLFEAYVRAGGLAGRLEAGEYTLSAAMTIPEIAAALQHAVAPGVTVAVRPGWRLEQTADTLTHLGVADGDEYRRAALAADLSGLAAEDRQRYSFLQFLPAGQSLEGYLYPDSYQLPRDGATAADLLRRQLDEFEQRVMPVYWEGHRPERDHAGPAQRADRGQHRRAGGGAGRGTPADRRRLPEPAGGRHAAGGRSHGAVCHGFSA
jgi:cell division protein YceG involved in septum cleavage